MHFIFVSESVPLIRDLLALVAVSDFGCCLLACLLVFSCCLLKSPPSLPPFHSDTKFLSFSLPSMTYKNVMVCLGIINGPTKIGFEVRDCFAVCFFLLRRDLMIELLDMYVHYCIIVCSISDKLCLAFFFVLSPSFFVYFSEQSVILGCVNLNMGGLWGMPPSGRTRPPFFFFLQNSYRL